MRKRICFSHDHGCMMRALLMSRTESGTWLICLQETIEETIGLQDDDHHKMQQGTMNSLTDVDFSSPVIPTDSMRMSIPSIVKQSPLGLEDVPIEDLQKNLQPVLRGIQRLDPRDVLSLETVPQGSGPRISSRESVRPIHQSISPPCNENTVRYIHISEAPDQYSIGIFIFPPHAKIPLHDHPGMCVLSRVLYGDLTRVSLDLVRPEDRALLQQNANTAQQQQHEQQHLDGKTSSSWLPWSKAWPRHSSGHHHQQQQNNYPEGTKLAYRNRVDRLVAPACTALFPFEGNLHEFVAGPQGAAVLDVLLPPYDTDHHRDCTFYHIHECSGFEKQNTDRDLVRIVPTGQPEDFHCISGSYCGLGEGD